jgi:hypothetical protein
MATIIRGCLFGLNQDLAKHAISTTCRSVIVHAGKFSKFVSLRIEIKFLFKCRIELDALIAAQLQIDGTDLKIYLMTITNS